MMAPIGRYAKPDQVREESSLRQLDDERCPGAGLGVELKTAAHALGELARDVQPETRSTRRARELRVGAIELLEDSLLIGQADSRTSVGDTDPDHAVRTVRMDLHRTGAVLDGVVQQVDEHLLNPVAVARGGADIWRYLDLDRCGLWKLWPDRLDRCAHDVGDVHRLPLHTHVAAVEPARQQHLLCDLAQSSGLRRDHLQKLLPLLRGEDDVFAE